MAVVADLVILIALWRASAGGPVAGAYWALAVPLLGPVTYARLDLVVVAVVVLAWLLAPRRPLWAGALLAVATGLGLWPAAVFLPLLALVPRGSRRLAVAGYAVISLAFIAVGFLGGGWDRLASPITRALTRGLSLESIPGLPTLVDMALSPGGIPVARQRRHGGARALGRGSRDRVHTAGRGSGRRGDRPGVLVLRRREAPASGGRPRRPGQAPGRDPADSGHRAGRARRAADVARHGPDAQPRSAGVDGALPRGPGRSTADAPLVGLGRAPGDPDRLPVSLPGPHLSCGRSLRRRSRRDPRPQRCTAGSTCLVACSPPCVNCGRARCRPGQ
ncbi:MAG: DUF2029 domain-containing protein [Actinomycetales bacterium]|uniref:DUF2029 domain-containing protein n=1 Tax=Candidatus Phosphoribacter hodrii TaxID=2953743 RepID=A0A9D7Y3J5_9MICO|nr:DUF2029 domain-containing protein [Candidatus Phosphoribacter hodrii]